jgi:hypothetical protein
VSASNLEKLLVTRFPDPEYAVFFEVPNATGGAANGYADALVIGLWPSRGLLVHGFEMKASRGDWLREMKDPAKAERHARYCDRWSLLVSDVEIVKQGELPANWGLWAPRGAGLVCVREPQPLTPAPVDRLFLAALARSAQKMAAKVIARSGEQQELERRLKQQREEFDSELAERIEAGIRVRQRDAERLRETVEAFEKASGLSIANIGHWSAANLGEAVQVVQALHGRPHQVIEGARTRLREALAALDAIPQEAVHAGESLL